MAFDDTKLFNGQRCSGMPVRGSSPGPAADFVIVPLGNGKGYAKVSPEDLHKVNAYKWHLHNGYAVTDTMINSRRKVLLMHRFILGLEGGDRTDHINRDRLDNRRPNLRVANASQNAANALGLTNSRKSKYKGVYRKRGGWSASITKDGRTHHLGNFGPHEEEVAARAYDSAALYLFREFAVPNFLDSIPIDPSKLLRHKRKRGRGFEASFVKIRGKWVSRIRDRGYIKHIGYFTNKEDAISAGEEAVRIHRAGAEGL